MDHVDWTQCNWRDKETRNPSKESKMLGPRRGVTKNVHQGFSVFSVILQRSFARIAVIANARFSYNL